MAKPWTLQARQSAKDSRWYVRLAGGNGEPILRSRGFKNVDAAVQLCKLVQASEITVETDPEALAVNIVKPMKGSDGQFYNRLFLGKDEMMWSEGYARVDSAQRACEKMRAAMVVTLTPLAIS